MRRRNCSRKRRTDKHCNGRAVVCVQPSPIVVPKSSVMRSEMSPEMSHWVAEGTSAVFDQATVGSDISSATQEVVGRQRDLLSNTRKGQVSRVYRPPAVRR